MSPSAIVQKLWNSGNVSPACAEHSRQAATGLDIGQGVIVRYDEQVREVVGLTIVGVGRRLEEYVKTKA